MANKTTAALTAATLPLAGAELIPIVQGSNSRKVTAENFVNIASLKWLSKGIGELYAVDDSMTGADVPPTNNPLYRYIKLTAGLAGSGAYNDGVLTSESLSGSAPLVVATAVISLSGSPLNGRTVNLINTERRVLRAGAPGTVEADALQGFKVNIGGSGSASGAFGVTAGAASSQLSSGPVSDGTNGTPRVANETRAKNIGVTYYMRIK